MTLREIKFVGTKKFTLNAVKDTFVNYMKDNGEIITKTTALIKPDPRGNWEFTKVGAGKYEYTFKETERWLNLTPKKEGVSDALNFQNPDVTNKLGPDVAYVTIEEVLLSLSKSIKRSFNANELKVVATKENASAIQAVIDHPDGLPVGAVLNAEYLDPNYVSKAEQAEIKKIQEIEKGLISRLISDPAAAKDIFEKAQSASKPVEEVKSEEPVKEDPVEEVKPEPIKEEPVKKTVTKGKATK